MTEDEDRPRPKLVHAVGERLDSLSVHELDERIAALRAEIERLETAKLGKRAAADAAGSVFKR